MRLHSQIDYITNSSSTTYTWPLTNAKKKIIKILKGIIKLSGSNKKVEDLFDIYEEVDPAWVESVSEHRDYLELSDEELSETITTGIFDHDKNQFDTRFLILKVVPKNNSKIDYLKDILDLFQTEEVSMHTLMPE